MLGPLNATHCQCQMQHMDQKGLLRGCPFDSALLGTFQKFLSLVNIVMVTIFCLIFLPNSKTCEKSPVTRPGPSQRDNPLYSYLFFQISTRSESGSSPGLPQTANFVLLPYRLISRVQPCRKNNFNWKMNFFFPSWHPNWKKNNFFPS